MTSLGFTKGHRGFRIGFNNGYTISVQFGAGNYCNNYNMRVALDMNAIVPDVLSSPDAEVAILYHGDLITQDIWFDIFKEHLDDSVAAHITPEKLAIIIGHISSLPDDINTHE